MLIKQYTCIVCCCLFFQSLVLEHYEEFLGDCWKVGLSVGASRGLYGSLV